MKLTLKQLSLAIVGAGLLTIYGCGGGGSSAAPSNVTTTFSGVAATGAALAGATVNINCAAGSGSTTTNPTDGSYSVDIKNITLPCVLRATSSDNTTVLYSVTSATATSSNTQVANITPLTQLLVASLTGGEPKDFFENVTTSPAIITNVVTDSAIGTAQTAVLSTLGNAGIDVSNLSGTSLVNGTLVAGSPTNAHDVALEALSAKLESTGTTLAILTTTVADTSTTASSTGTTTATANVAKLPAALLLSTADKHCAALRSGDYWAISPVKGGNMADQFTSGSYNAGTKTATNLVGDSAVFSNASTACSYHLASDTASVISDIVVSQAGVVVARYQDGGGVYRLGFAIPKQAIAVSELEGTWNALGFEVNDGSTSYSGRMWTATVGSTGVTGDATACDGTSLTSTCSAVSTSELPTFSSNSDGGFNVTTPAFPNDAARAFAYRAGNGDLMLVMVSGNDSVSVWTHKRTQSLPTVGAIQGAGWSIRTLGTLVANALSSGFTNTITAIDSSAGSYTRTVNLANGTADYSETILLNTPLAGYNFRAIGSTTSVFDGRLVKLRERTSLGLRGMGVSVQSVPVQTDISSAGFQMSVDQP